MNTIDIISKKTFEVKNLFFSPYVDTCKPSTCKPSPLFEFVAGQKYVYDFESNATVRLINDDSVEASVGIKGRAVVIAGENCEHMLVLKKVIIVGSDNSEKVIPQRDFTLPVQFVLSGDELAPQICADESDGAFSLNIKRGLISALQNSLDQSTEFDIFGKCKISRTSSVSGNETSVYMTKDLSDCSLIKELPNGLIPGVVSSAIKVIPMFDGKIESEAFFNNRTLQGKILKESYVFKPSNIENLFFEAKIVSILVLKKSKKNLFVSTEEMNLIPRSLLFDEPKEKINVATSFDKILREFSGQTFPKSVAVFAEIIRSMKLAKKEDLLTAYKVSFKFFYSKIFLDLS